jgi:L-ascorbate metabolism protein UlaG (beta-lactamase superfamily)
MKEKSLMKVRYLGHSCVEIIGQHHILIDPDFTREFEPDVEYILITHAHRDHIGRVNEVPDAYVLASQDVCEIVTEMGVASHRVLPVLPGYQVANIKILPGFSRTNDPLYTFFYVLFRMRFPEPGGTPLSFLIKDEATLLHIGDAHEASLSVRPDILCLPWRTTPFRSEQYKNALVRMAEQFSPPYILPIHYDLSHSEADPSEIKDLLPAEVLDDFGWYRFFQSQLIRSNQ